MRTLIHGTHLLLGGCQSCHLAFELGSRLLQRLGGGGVCCLLRLERFRHLPGSFSTSLTCRLQVRRRSLQLLHLGFQLLLCLRESLFMLTRRGLHRTLAELRHGGEGGERVFNSLRDIIVLANSLGNRRGQAL